MSTYSSPFCSVAVPAFFIAALLRSSDSLYIEAITYTDELFYKYYNEILGQYFKIDYFGINYFTKAQAKKILEDISQKELPDKEIFINWLNEAVEKYNGFYILGV